MKQSLLRLENILERRLAGAENYQLRVMVLLLLRHRHHHARTTGDGTLNLCGELDRVEMKWDSHVQSRIAVERAPGQKINREKSTLCFSPNTSPDIKTEFQRKLGFREARDLGTYLGMSSIVRQYRYVIFEGVRDKMRRALQRWEGAISVSSRKRGVNQSCFTDNIYLHYVSSTFDQAIVEVDRLFKHTGNTDPSG
ncbi:hypothetical protein AKJ16_DCAP02366 [Drosera capensis]